MEKKLLLISFFATVFFSLTANAAVTPDLTVLGPVSDALKAASADKLLPMATTSLGLFLSLQFVFTQIKVLTTGGDISTVFAKVLGNLFWIVFCIYVLNNGPDFINSVGQEVLSKFGSGLGIGAILTSTITLTAAILTPMMIAEKLSAGVGQFMLVMGIGVFFSGMYLIIKIFMLQLELGLIVMLAPLSFSFLGMDALRDQGIAPFKSLLSLCYRIILIGVISAGFSKIFGVAVTDIQSISAWSPWQGIQTLMGILAAFPILVFLLFKSDAIASSLAGGHTSMSAGDVGGAAAAGAALGGAASGAAVAVKSGLPPGMLGNMMGGGAGSVSNGGSGGRPREITIDPPPPRPPSNSLHSPEAFAQAKAAFHSGGSSAASARDPNKPLTFSQMAMKQFNPDPAPTAPSSSGSQSGNAADAGIGGNSGGSSSGNQTPAPRQQDSLGQRIKDLNQHIAQEKAATHVSINPHAGD
jgi:type IV secretion system protein TrbL